MATKRYLRKEPCPKCGTPDVRVHYLQEKDSVGQVVVDIPRTAECPNQDCQWYDPRTRPVEDVNQAAARVVREATEGK